LEGTDFSYRRTAMVYGGKSATEVDAEITEVLSPPHYRLFPDAEVIDVIRKVLTAEEFDGYCKGNILKYRLRAGEKGDAERDLSKASVYNDWLQENLI
jgi:hypothetical protein